ncbi:uncharacterized protein LOC132546767 [Ylistrum balloti]|uniref:uncharacterized protein LOC132546767 n=1 Tax=Ylistrum balloti TaxID=509963 RepID=UPI002905AE01|nr:uncharacterized protein LOC132546767 [Ylistrum balloti]
MDEYVIAEGDSFEMRVSVVDSDSLVASSICQSYNDPHIRTFDGRNWENQRLGEFILFHNRLNHYWVHVMYQTCVSGVTGATCNCGIAIRKNNVLFVANFCDARIGWTASNNETNSNRYIEGTFCDDTHMTVESSGSSYKVTLPTGTQISFYYNTHNGTTTIDGIAIKPSLADWKTSSGLCGYLDGDKDNDFRTRDNGTTNDDRTFAQDWKVSGESDVSLFGEVNLPDDNTGVTRFCKCRDSATPGDSAAVNECNINTATTLCSSSGSASFFNSCEGSARRKRSASELLLRQRRASHIGNAIAKFPIVLDNDVDSEPMSMSWRNGWDESSATETCRQFLQNQKFLEKCEILDGMKNETADGIKSCVEDIKLIGDDRFMQSTSDTLSQSCRLTAIRLENLTKTSASDGAPGKTMLDEMLDLDCRKNCSRNGICANGSCTCFDDFEGDDCSIRRSVPPIVSTRTNPGLCQSDSSTCTTFYISGSNFASENVTCRAIQFTVVESTYQLTSNNVTFPAVPMSGGIGCFCSLSQSVRARRSVGTDRPNGLFLSVSNDGFMFSNNIVIIVYDSTCYTCRTNPISCIIKSSCQSTTSTTTPSTTEAYSHVTNGYVSSGLIAGAVVGGLCGVIAVLLLTKAIASLKQTKKYSHPVSEDDMVNYYRQNTYWEHIRGYPSDVPSSRFHPNSDENQEKHFQRNTYWEYDRGYPRIGRLATSSRMNTRFY